MKTCKKGLHQYAEGGCKICRNDYSKNLMRKRRREAGIPERVYVKGRTIAESNRIAGKKWRLEHPAEYRALQKAVTERAGIGYAAHAMHMRVGEVPLHILEAKSVLIKLNRQIKRSSHA